MKEVKATTEIRTVTRDEATIIYRMANDYGCKVMSLKELVENNIQITIRGIEDDVTALFVYACGSLNATK